MVSPASHAPSLPAPPIERARIHPFWRLCLCALGFVGVQILVGALVLAAVVGVALVGGRNVPGAINSVTQMATDNALAITLLSYPPMIGWIALCRTKFDRASFASLGLRRRNVTSNLLRGALAGLLAMAFGWSVLWFSGAIVVNGWSPALLEQGWNSLLPLAGFALAFAAVGFFEELLFRGYILHNFHGWLGWKWAVAIQAILFAIVHLGNVIGGTSEQIAAALGGLPNIALVGIAFALMVRKTGSLWFPIGFHAAWNFSLGCLFSLPVSGLPTFRLLDVQSGDVATGLSGGSFGAEGSWLLWPILGALIYFLAKAPDHPQALLDLKLNRPEPTPAPAFIDEQESVDESEDARENRFKARFGSEVGFDSGTLSSLRALQQGREEAAREASQQEEQERLARQTPLEPMRMVSDSSTKETVDFIEPETLIESEAVVEPTPVPEVIAPPIVAPIVVASPVVSSTKAPDDSAPKPKKPAPRW